MFRLLAAFVVLVVLAGTAVALLLSRVDRTAGLAQEDPWSGVRAVGDDPDDD